MGFSRAFHALLGAFLVTLTAWVPSAHARDLGFRYNGNACVDAQGKAGLNPAYIGPCGDLRHVIMARLDLSEVDLSGSRFDSSDLQETSFHHATLDGVNFSGANLAGVDLTAAIIRGASFLRATMKNTHLAGAQLSGVDFSGVDFSGGQLSYLTLNSCNITGANFAGAALDHADFSGSNGSAVNFGGANLTEARLENASLAKADFSAADLSSASLKSLDASGGRFANAILRGANLEAGNFGQVVFRSAQLTNAMLKGAKFNKADLRSAVLKDASVEAVEWKEAVFNARTVLPFTPEMAQSLGMTLQKNGGLLIVWDKKSDDVQTLMKSLNDAGIEAAYSTQSNTTFTGDERLADFAAVLHLNGSTESQDMPMAGQQALLSFVKNGGVYIGSEWNSYGFQNGRFQGMRDLILLDRSSGSQTRRTYKVVAAQMRHPLLDGVTDFMMQSGFSTGKAHVFATEPATVLMTDDGGSDAIIVRNVGSGKAVDFSFTINYNSDLVLNLPAVQRLISNAASLQ